MATVAPGYTRIAYGDFTPGLPAVSRPVNDVGIGASVKRREDVRP